MHTKQRRVDLRNASCCDCQLWRVLYGWTEVTIVGVDSEVANPGMQAIWSEDTCDLKWKNWWLPIIVTTYFEGYEDLSFNHQAAHMCLQSVCLLLLFDTKLLDGQSGPKDLSWDQVSVHC